MALKICSIGTGYWGAYSHGPAYKRYAELHDDVEFAACCDINEKDVIEFQNKFGFKRHYTDFVEMLNTEKPDAVCLVVSVEVTAKLAVRILEMGYPIITEKPPGMTKEQTLQMIAAAEKSGKANMVAFNRRYTPLISKLREMLDVEHKPEGIQNICCDFYRVNRKDPDFSTTAVHGIDTVRSLAGCDYKDIKFSYQELPEKGPGVCNIFMDCVFKSGATAQLRFCPTIGITFEHYTVHTDNNSYFVEIPQGSGEGSVGKLQHFEGNKLVLSVDSKDLCNSTEHIMINGFYEENTMFFEDVKAGRMPVNDLKSGLQTVEISEYIRKRLPEYHA